MITLRLPGNYIVPTASIPDGSGGAIVVRGFSINAVLEMHYRFPDLGDALSGILAGEEGSPESIVVALPFAQPTVMAVVLALATGVTPHDDEAWTEARDRMLALPPEVQVEAARRVVELTFTDVVSPRPAGMPKPSGNTLVDGKNRRDAAKCTRAASFQDWLREYLEQADMLRAAGMGELAGELPLAMLTNRAAWLLRREGRNVADHAIAIQTAIGSVLSKEGGQLFSSLIGKLRGEG